MKIVEVRSGSALKTCFPVLRELRTHLDFAQFSKLYLAARKSDDYRLVGMFADKQCVALMGYRILFDFVHGKHVYIDDLIVTRMRRSQGLGAILLKHAEEIAVEKRCSGLRLCTGIDRKDSQRFYERNGWSAKAFAYKKPLPL